MDSDIIKRFALDSDEKKIMDFVESRKNTIGILEAIEPLLNRHFPKSDFSLELCDELAWTTETKLLVNVHVNHEMFFNGLLNHFNDIYREIEPVIMDIENTVVLFPDLDNDDYDKLANNCAINLIARTSYFNNHNNGITQREVGFRNIPRKQKVNEIIEYVKTHANPNISDMVFDLRLELFDIDDIITELEEKGMELNVEY